mmetsp:Transcript_12607/g.11150  ORF Transcript_12607/g.11150 Transcript_12607/m.11150 type:complete len:127 (+) Transcript_12607:96-476(+)
MRKPNTQQIQLQIKRLYILNKLSSNKSDLHNFSIVAIKKERARYKKKTQFKSKAKNTKNKKDLYFKKKKKSDIIPMHPKSNIGMIMKQEESVEIEEISAPSTSTDDCFQEMPKTRPQTTTIKPQKK